MWLLTISTIATLIAAISGHGIVIKPPVRAIGEASLAACGAAITDIIKADNQSGIEILREASVNTPKFDARACNLLLCKGLQLADNLANVQTYYPGQEVNIQVWTRIPHKGWVSVAIVDAKTMFLVGEPLASFETDSISGYEEASVDMDFNITIPEDLGGICKEAGDCVIQWTWFGRVVKQTYESCIDFVVDDDVSNPSSSLEGGRQSSQGRLFDQAPY